MNLAERHVNTKPANDKIEVAASQAENRFIWCFDLDALALTPGMSFHRCDLQLPGV